LTAPVLTGQDIAEAEGAVHGLLETLLAGSEITADEYVMLRVLTLRPPMSPPEAYEFFASQRQLRRSRDELIAMLLDLGRRGLVTGLDGDGPVTPSQRGAALYGAILAQVQQVTQRLYAGLDPVELGQAKQTLAAVAERAHALRRELL
jgi:hypothetical protein